MVEIREKTNTLRQALERQDPYGVAKALTVPQVSTIKTTEKPISHPTQSLIVQDTDYSTVLTTLLDLCAAAETVRDLTS